MERQLQQQPPAQPQAEGLNNGGGNNGGTFLKVMTDEQMQVLRKQIAAYGTICERLKELHRSLGNSDDHVAGLRLGHPYSTSLMASSGQTVSRRQRWNPNAEQLHILERVFDRDGIEKPNGDKVKEITAELAQHGQISNGNVYNWFQNRRARLKKKQMLVAEANNTEPEVQPVDAKGKTPQKLQRRRHIPEPAVCFGRTPIYGRMSWEESPNHFLHAEDLHITGDAWWSNI